MVSGREFHQFLELQTKYTDWFKRMYEYRFIEGIDYILVIQKKEKLNMEPKGLKMRRK